MPRAPPGGTRLPSATLEGRVALVTGGAVRLGRTIVETLAAAGAAVVVHHHASGKMAEALAADLHARGRRAWTVRADLADAQEAADLLARATEASGVPIDLLVNSASVFPADSLAAPPAAWRDTLQVNALAPLALMGAFAAQEREGAIVNVLDTRIHHVARERAPYHVSKRMLAELTRTCALAYAPRVRVNAVAPGPILPPPGRDEAYLAARASRVPLRRPGAPADVAEAVLFLATAPYVTGAIVPVDGGAHLGGESDA